MFLNTPSCESILAHTPFDFFATQDMAIPFDVLSYRLVCDYADALVAEARKGFVERHSVDHELVQDRTHGIMCILEELHGKRVPIVHEMASQRYENAATVLMRIAAITDPSPVSEIGIVLSRIEKLLLEDEAVPSGYTLTSVVTNLAQEVKGMAEAYLQGVAYAPTRLR